MQLVPGVVRRHARSRRTGSGVALVAAVVVTLWLDAIVSAAAATTATSGAEHADDASPLFLINDERIREASGVALSRRHRLLWVHNDAGNDPIVFGMDAAGGTRAVVTVDGAKAED